ncbi:MAG TPA: circularly permuted type 2 ATP-grasp protein, partial [Pyrinomonadaceae bacterium]|nr:circularly permuted type 2 ATP-grasp protein [Pyrinomonadaceae bacterium]
MLPEIIRELDERILHDSRLDQPIFDQLIAAQHGLGLVFDGRPTCPFLRPHLISRSKYDEVSRASSTIAAAVERMVSRALNDEELLSVLGPTERETRMARIDPGYSRLCVSSRLDSYLSDSGFQFLEYNAETPAGVGDQMQLEKILFSLPHLKTLFDEHAHWRPQPHQRLLRSLLDVYREWGGAEERPQIAIVDWKGVATESEFRVLRQYFASEGYETIIADPNELIYDGFHLTRGDFRIDIVYKRVIIHEFLERCDVDHPLARAYADGRVCLVNSFRTKIAHKKAGFAVLSDPEFAHLFTPEEIEIFRKHIPWTRRVRPGGSTFHDSKQELIQLIRAERNRLVLKPNDDYGGHGVFIGWESTPEEWEDVIRIALKRPYVVQERVFLKKTPMPMFTDRVSLEEMFIDFNPFLFNNETE